MDSSTPPPAPRGRGGRGRSRGGRGRGRGGRGRGGGGGGSRNSNSNNNNNRRRQKGQQQQKQQQHNNGAPKKHPRSSSPSSSSRPESPSEAKRLRAAANATGVHVTETEFASLQLTSESQRAIAEVLGYKFLTEVQEKTLTSIIKGIDVLARARTGTGKTMGFLLPAVEKIAAGGKKQGISCLVISPTRELATQIAVEARALCKFHNFKVMVVLGGTNMNAEASRFNQHVDILVATPGRLIDHLTNTSGVVSKLGNLSTFVLDEADQLLDMGFRPDLLRITAFLPKKEQRQTLLFSATVPSSTQAFSKTMLKPDFEFVDTVGESTEQTNARVNQELIVTPFEQHLAAIHHVLSEHIRQRPNDYKIIIFFSTARVTQFNAQLFSLIGLQALEMHSRKSQAYRTRISNQFRANNKLIMFSSDVSARGVDYPDVSLCVQVGMTTREQYIHRVGRTARAGQSGQGMLLLAPFEKSVLQELKGLPIEDVTATVSSSAAFQESVATLDRTVKQVPGRQELKASAEQAYRAWLGFYNGNLKKLRWNKEKLVQVANQFAVIMGLTKTPTLLKRTVGKMGLRGTPGLRVE